MVSTHIPDSGVAAKVSCPPSQSRARAQRVKAGSRAARSGRQVRVNATINGRPGISFLLEIDDGGPQRGLTGVSPEQETRLFFHGLSILAALTSLGARAYKSRSLPQ